jgi:hypothetical protein
MGIGCAALALLLLPLAVGLLELAFRSGETDGAAMLFGIAGMAIGTLSALFGIGLFRQGRRIGKLLKGEGLIAHWTYQTDKIPDGFVFIGEDGVYHNAVYTEWSSRCFLESVEIVPGETDLLLINYIIQQHNSNVAASGATIKKLRVPIPKGKEADAQRVVDHFR